MIGKKKILFTSMCAAAIIVMLSLIIKNPYLGAFEDERLGALKYAAWTPAEANIEKTGVTLHDPALSCAGNNLYNYDGFPGVYLVGMDGEVLRSWTMDAEDLHYVEMCPDGGLLGIDNQKKLIRIEPEGSVGWELTGHFHHDVCVSDDGIIYALINKTEQLGQFGIKEPVLVPYVNVISPKGKTLRGISIAATMSNAGIKPDAAKTRMMVEQWKTVAGLRSVLDSIVRHIKKHGIGRKFFARLARRMISPEMALFTISGGQGPPGVDIFHANTLEVIERDVFSDGRQIFNKGDLLVCFRNLDIIAVIDPVTERIKWTWGPGEIRMPHHPSLLKNGNILIFDNGAAERRYSRVIEVEPGTGKVVWKYMSDPPEEFYSRIRGSAQRLPNGNTLIMESSAARAFEVTKDGRVVWEFYGSAVEPEKKRRRPIYRISRSFGTVV
jgi:hypothetical protein